MVNSTRSLFFFALFLLTACEPGLERQPKVKADEEATFFPDQSGARSALPGTVSYLAPVDEQPKLSRALLERGQARYEIYCSVCHGLSGEGDGLAINRGFTKPRSFHTEISRQETVTQIDDAITQGKGAMLAFSDRIPTDDRWAISFYVKALQLRAHFPKKLLKPNEIKNGDGS